MSVDKRIICRFVDPDELVPVGEAPVLCTVPMPHCLRGNAIAHTPNQALLFMPWRIHGIYCVLRR